MLERVVDYFYQRGRLRGAGQLLTNVAAYWCMFGIVGQVVTDVPAAMQRRPAQTLQGARLHPAQRGVGGLVAVLQQRRLCGQHLLGHGKQAGGVGAIGGHGVEAAQGALHGHRL